MILQIDINNPIAVICEGKSEQTIVEILLERDLLLFNRSHLIDRQILNNNFRNPEKFSKSYLASRYYENISVILILDHIQSFEIPQFFQNSIKAKIFILTQPEIEILMILALGLFNDYQKEKSRHHLKPSIYLKKKLRAPVKSSQFITQFNQQHDLVSAIYAYHQVRPNKKSYSIKNLLK